MPITFFEIASILSPVVSVLITIIAFRRNQKADDSASAREMGMMLTELGYIKSQVDGLSRKLENTDEKYTRLIERVTAVEQITKKGEKIT